MKSFNRTKLSKESNRRSVVPSYQRTQSDVGGRATAAITSHRRKQLVTVAALVMVAALLLASLIGAMTPAINPDFAWAAVVSPYAETARVGGRSPLAYKGVNSMVGTLISWGADNYTTTETTVGSWYIDNNGYIVWGSSGNHNLPITYAVPKDNSLSKIQLTKATNGVKEDFPSRIQTADGKMITIDNLVKAESGLGSYFTIGSEGRTSEQAMADDWEKAIVAASHYSKSGILQNEMFGTKSALDEREFPNDDTWAEDFNRSGATGGFGKQQNTEVANYTYIYIRLMADWVAPIVNTMREGGTQTVPGDGKTYIDRFVVEARNKTAEDAEEEAGVTHARGAGYFEFFRQQRRHQYASNGK